MVLIFDLDNVRYMYITDPYLVEWVYTECWKEAAIMVDVETTRKRDLPEDLEFDENIFKPGLDPYLSDIRLLQIGLKDCVHVIDCFKCPNVSIFGAVMASEDILKIGHNFKFDMKQMMCNFGFKFRRIYDTMLASQLLSNGISAHYRSHNLAAVAQRYLKLEVSKEEQASDWGAEILSDKQIRYAAIDVAVLRPLATAQLAHMRNPRLGIDMLAAAKLEFDCAIATAKLELDGLYVDPELWEEADLEIRTAYFDLRDRVRLALGKDDINLNSPKQVLEVLQDQGIPIQGTNSKTDLDPLRDKYPVIQLLMEFRGLDKLLSSYGNGIPDKRRRKGQVFFLERVHPITGRVHSEFGQLATNTGRFNSSKPNTQQIPKEDKGKFRQACTGQTINGVKNQFIVADWSQFEMRILAWFSKDKNLMDAFSLGDDLHTATASMMFEVPLENIRYTNAEGKKVEGKDFWMRDAAKSINFGLVYGRGLNSLAAQIGVTTQRAKELMAQYFRTFSGAKAWLDKTANDGIRHGMQQTISGRVRYFEFDHYNRAEIASVERESKNTPIQGSNADMLKISMFRLVEELEARGWEKDVKLVNVIHDEINLEAPPHLAEAVCELTKGVMESVGNEMLYPVPVLADAGYGLDWTIK